MKLIIGIVNYNTKNKLKKCVESLNKNSPGCSYSIIILDNNSTDSSRKYLKKINRPEIGVILNNKNIGYGKACNKIATMTDSEYLLFLNADVMVEDNSIGRMLEFIQKNPDVGLVSGKLLNNDGTVQYSCRKFPSIIRALTGRESIIRKIFPNNPLTREYFMADENYNSIMYPEWVRGAVMMVNRRVFESVGGFDERFFLYLEDTDLCYRIRSAGYRIAYYPHSIFYHDLGSSTEKKKLLSRLIHNTSMFLYIKKYSNFNKIFVHLLLIPLFIRITLLILNEILMRARR